MKEKILFSLATQLEMEKVQFFHKHKISLLTTVKQSPVQEKLFISKKCTV